MAAMTLESSLLNLKGATVEVSASGVPSDPGAASVELTFSDGTRLRSEYWRTVNHGKAGFSSFDHKQQYGLPAPIDAFAELRRELSGKAVVSARHDSTTGDLLFAFDGEIEFQVFNFTGYEVWAGRFVFD